MNKKNSGARNHSLNLVEGRGEGQKESPEFAVTSQVATTSALPRLETAMRLVDHVDPAFAADDAVVAVPRAQGFQRVSNFHNDTG